MRSRRGLARFALEGAFLVVVAVVVALLEPSWIAIALILAGALLLAIGFDRYAASRERRGERILPRRPERPAKPEHAPEPRAATAEPLVDEEESVQDPVDETPRSRGRLGRRPRPAGQEAPQQAAAATAVVPPATEDAAEPREWNVWALDRLARDGAGIDAARDEERALLLMHLREFAGPDGLLPASFDDVVRESFGELVAAGHA